MIEPDADALERHVLAEVAFSGTSTSRSNVASTVARGHAVRRRDLEQRTTSRACAVWSPVGWATVTEHESDARDQTSRRAAAAAASRSCGMTLSATCAGMPCVVETSSSGRGSGRSTP